MTVTQNPIVATNCVIKLDDASGTPVDISGSLNKVEIAYTAGVATYRPFGTQWPRRQVVGKDATISVTAVYSSPSDEAAPLIQAWALAGNDAARTLDIYAPDSTAGSFRYIGEFVLASTNIPLDSEADDVVRVTFECQVHGEFVLATVAS